MVDPAGVDTPGIAASRRGSTRAEVVLGVDFGTSYTSAGAMIDGRVDLVRDNGDAVIPSVVYVPARGEPVVTSGRLSPIDLARARVFADALSDARSDPGSAAGELLAMLASSGLPVRPVEREAWATSPLDARIADALSATVFTPGTLATAKVLAAQLGMDEKPTLRAINDYLRRLHLTVRSWQAYATRIRVDLGLFAMSAPGARTEEIARLLGFSSPTAFCHAFTRAGLPSPGAIRDILRRDLAA